MLHSRDFETPALDEIELGHLYERALERSAQLRALRTRRRAAGGMAALGCVVVAGLVVGSFAAATPGRRTVAGPSLRHTTWRLVSEVSAADSSWQALSPSGYQQTFSLVCPNDTTCYADSIGGAAGIHPRRRLHLAAGDRHRDRRDADVAAADLVRGRPGLRRPL